MAQEGRKSPKESNYLLLAARVISAKDISLMSKVSFSPIKLFLLLERDFTQKVVQSTQFMLFLACFFSSSMPILEG